MYCHETVYYLRVLKKKKKKKWERMPGECMRLRYVYAHLSDILLFPDNYGGFATVSEWKLHG